MAQGPWSSAPARKPWDGTNTKHKHVHAANVSEDDVSNEDSEESDSEEHQVAAVELQKAGDDQNAITNQVMAYAIKGVRQRPEG